MIADLILSIVNFFTSNALGVLPTSLFLNFSTFQGVLNSVQGNFIFTFSVIGKVMDISFLLLIFLTIFSAEITLLIYRVSLYVLKFVRG